MDTPHGSPPYSAVAIANGFIERCKKEGIYLSHMQLQKLVYMAHGWHLAYHDTSLVASAFEAWRYGPVAPDLYYQANRWGRSEIPVELIPEFDSPGEHDIREGDDRTRSLIDKVWKRYGGLSASQLSKLTHRPDTPWHQARERMAQGGSGTLHTQDIKLHFDELLEDLRKKSDD